MNPSAFGRWVRDRLRELGISQRQFAIITGYSSGNMNKMINGSHSAPPPPLGLDCAKWAEVLQIPNDQIKKFHLYAACAHLPEAVRVEFENIVDQHIELRNDYIKLQNEIRRSPRVADGE